MFINHRSATQHQLTRIVPLIVLVSALVMTTVTTAYAAAGDLDPTFGNGSVAFTNTGFESEEFYATTTQPDGQIVVVGGSNNFGLAQYLAGALAVNSLADTLANNDACTLREAITNANNDDQSGSTDCAAGSGADIITFSVSGTITLGSTLPTITSEIVIDGTGQAVVISGNNTVRVFYMTSTGNLALDTITVQDGHAGSGVGGGIYNSGGILTLTNSILSNNSTADGSGGGIFNAGGTLTVTNSSLSNNSASGDSAGGGIFNDGGTLTITNSTLSGNSSVVDSGAVWNSGILDITDSTLSGNSASSGSGGGISNYVGGILTVTNSIVSNNSASISGGGINNGGTLTINNSTFSGNRGDGGGAVTNGGTLVITNSSLSGNSSPSQGGGIENWSNGIVTVNHSTLSENSANYHGGAVMNSGMLDITDSTLSGNTADYGGGIRNDGGTLIINNSTLSGNSATYQGGAIENDETLVITNSTISGNSVTAFSPDGYGGGIFNGGTGTVTVLNSTFSDNSASPELGNGGGIYNNNGTVYLASTILDTGASGGNCYGAATDNGYNLSDDGSCSFNAVGSQNDAALNLGVLADNGGPAQTHLPGAGSTAIDLIPNGTTISNNGVSYTCDQTSEPLDTDQRGQPRPATVAGSCDAGAVEATDLLGVPMLLAPANGSITNDNTPGFDWDDVTNATQYHIQVDNNADFSSPEIDEMVASSTFIPTSALADGIYSWHVRSGNAAGEWSDTSETWTVTVQTSTGITITTTTDELNANGACSLREAITNANNDNQSGSTDCAAGSGADTITFSVSGTITLGSILPTITSEIVIDGTGQAVVISGSNTVRTFYMTSIGNLTLDTITVQDSHAGSGVGGGIYNNGGILTLANSILSNNSTADGSGGGIFNAGGTLTVTNSSLSNNSAGGDSAGGGIFNDGGTLTITNSTLSGNSSVVDSGAVWNSGTLDITDSTLSGNSASSGSGGGISNYVGGILTVTNSIVSNNSASLNGGGINNGGTLIIDNSTFSGNRGDGGGAVANGGTLVITNSTLSGNSSSGRGGGIENLSTGTITVTHSTLSDNSAPGGGAIQNSGTLDITDSTLSGNTADYDGGGISNYVGTLTINNSTLSGNLASYQGGAIENNGTLVIANTTLSGNAIRSIGDGGGIFNGSTGTSTVINSTFSGNSIDDYSDGNGGGIYNNNGTVYLASTILDTGASGENCYGVVTNNGYNLSDDASCGFSGTGSQNNVPLNLGLLADNGGPTQTHLPGASSAAINLIPNGTTINNNGVNYTCDQTSEPLDTDQRGQPRPATASGRCDAGAVEVTDLPGVTTLLAPANGATTSDTTPTFDWSDVAGATRYRLQLDDAADFSSPLAIYRTNVSTYTPIRALRTGTYYWRVRMRDASDIWGAWSAPWTLAIVAPLPAPALLSPANGSTTSNSTPVFHWSDVAGMYRYQLQVDDNAHFSSPVVSLNQTVSTYTTGTALATGTYYWRVRVLDTMGTWGAWSRVWALTIIAPQPAPTLLSPANGSTTSDSTPTFDWSAVAGMYRYQLQVDDNTDFSSPLATYKTAASTYTLTTVLSAGTYYWRVRTRGASGTWGDWSTSWILISSN